MASSSSSKVPVALVAVAGIASLAAATAAVIFCRKSGGGDRSHNQPAAGVRKPAVPRSATPQAQPTAAPPKQVDPRAVSVIFGSNTGTAELFAKNLVADGRRKGFLTKLVPASEFASDADGPLFGGSAAADHGEGREAQVFVFVVATYGEGDPTDDFRDAWENITKIKRTAAFRAPPGTKIAIFGLGDTSYKYYCQVAKNLDLVFMNDFGCERIAATAYGDARADLEGAFDVWAEELWPELARVQGVALSDAPLMPELQFAYLPEGTAPDAEIFPSPPSKLEPTARRPLRVKLSSSRALVQGPPRPDQPSVMHVELDITGLSVVYQAGDHCGILPCNSDEAVGRCLKALGITDEAASRVVELTSEIKMKLRSSRVNRLPARVSLRDCLKWYVDLSSAPKKSTLRVCVQYCTDADEKERFASLLRVGNESAFRDMTKTHRTVVHFLEAFPSCRVDLGHFLEALPAIKPRYYSIASDQSKHSQSIHLCVGLVADGLCSQLLCGLAPGDSVFLFVRKSTFHLPLRNKEKPVIMIGPGTGIAPFIGFCQRRESWRRRDIVLGTCLLFFGCRFQSGYLYREQLEEWTRKDDSLATSSSVASQAAAAASAPIISELLTAISREDPSGRKRYVQHLVREKAAEVVDLILKKGAYVFICGDASHMAKDVEETLLQLFVEAGEFPSADAAKAKLVQLEKEGRYLKDVWTT